MLSRKAPLLVLQNVINALVGLVGMFFLTRFIPLSWSILSFGLAFAGLFMIVSDIGFSTANIRLQSQGEDEGVCNSTFLISKLVFGGAYVLLTLGALVIWVVVLRHGFEYTQEFWVVIAIIPYYFFSGLVQGIRSVNTAKLRPARIVIPSIVEVILRNSIFVLVALAYFYRVPGMSPEELAIVLAGVYSFTYTVFFVFSFIIARPWKFSPPSRKMFTKYMGVALPLALSGIVSTINQNVDKVIIQFFWGVHATGAFFLDQKITMVLTTFTMSISIFMLPVLSRMHTTGTREEMNLSVKEFERIVTLISLPIATVFGIMSLYVVNIFSGFFVDYYYILSYLSLFAIISLNSYPYWNALIANGQQKMVGIINASGLAVNIALNLLTIPPEVFGTRIFSLGVLGGAVSTVIASIIMNIAFRIQLYRTSGSKFNFELFRLLVPTLVQAVFLYFASMYLKPYDILILGPVTIISLVLYTLVSIAIREMSWGELITFLRKVNPLELSKALKEE